MCADFSSLSRSVYSDLAVAENPLRKTRLPECKMQKPSELAETSFSVPHEALDERSKDVARLVVERRHVARDAANELDAAMTRGQCAANAMAAGDESWIFITCLIRTNDGGLSVRSGRICFWESLYMRRERYTVGGGAAQHWQCQSLRPADLLARHSPLKSLGRTCRVDSGTFNEHRGC